MEFDDINELIFDKIYREEAHNRFGVRESSVYADMYVEDKKKEQDNTIRID